MGGLALGCLCGFELLLRASHDEMLSLHLEKPRNNDIPGKFWLNRKVPFYTHRPSQRRWYPSQGRNLSRRFPGLPKLGRLEKGAGMIEVLCVLRTGDVMVLSPAPSAPLSPSGPPPCNSKHRRVRYPRAEG